MGSEDLSRGGSEQEKGCNGEEGDAARDCSEANDEHARRSALSGSRLRVSRELKN
jgi:hypothetical protein